jgi:hypothetical protein
MPLYTSFLTNGKNESSFYVGATGTSNTFKKYEDPIDAFYVFGDYHGESLIPGDIGASRTKALTVGYRYGILDNFDIGPNILLLQFGREISKNTIRPGLGIEWKANIKRRLTLAGEFGCMFRQQMELMDGNVSWQIADFFWSYAFFGGFSLRYGKEFSHGQIISGGPYLSFLTTEWTNKDLWKNLCGMLMLGTGYEKNIGNKAILINAQIAPITGTMAITLSTKIAPFKKRNF